MQKTWKVKTIQTTTIPTAGLLVHWEESITASHNEVQSWKSAYTNDIQTCRHIFDIESPEDSWVWVFGWKPTFFNPAESTTSFNQVRNLVTNIKFRERLGRSDNLSRVFENCKLSLAKGNKTIWRCRFGKWDVGVFPDENPKDWDYIFADLLPRVLTKPLHLRPIRIPVPNPTQPLCKRRKTNLVGSDKYWHRDPTFKKTSNKTFVHLLQKVQPLDKNTKQQVLLLDSQTAGSTRAVRNSQIRAHITVPNHDAVVVAALKKSNLIDTVFHGSTDDFLTTNPKTQFSAIYLDTCGNFSPSLLSHILQSHLQPNSLDDDGLDATASSGVVLGMTWFLGRTARVAISDGIQDTMSGLKRKQPLETVAHVVAMQMADIFSSYGLVHYLQSYTSSGMMGTWFFIIKRKLG